MISKNQIKYVHQLELKKFRKQEGLFIAEGHKVVGDLLAAGFRPKQIFATKEWIKDPLHLPLQGESRYHWVSDCPVCLYRQITFRCLQ